MRIDHVRLLVVNFAECFRFYRDVIGLNVKWGQENDSYASFSVPGQAEPNLAIFSRAEMAQVLGTDKLPGQALCQDRSLLIVGVEDVDASVARFQAMGVKFVLGAQDFPDWGMRGAYLRDPDGNLIELTGALPRQDWTPELRQADEQYNPK